METQDIIKQTVLDSQRLSGQVRVLRKNLEDLEREITAKNDSCLREMTPRIDQLESRIEIYWSSVAKMDQAAWADLEAEKNVLAESIKVVDAMDSRITGVADQL